MSIDTGIRRRITPPRVSTPNAGQRAVEPRLSILMGGTDASTAPEAAKNLGVPRLDENNIFTGQCAFTQPVVMAQAETALVGGAIDLVLQSTDTVTLRGPEDAVLDLTALTDTRSFTFPDASGTLALAESSTQRSGTYSGTGKTGSVGAQTLATAAGALYRLSAYVVASASVLGVLTVTAAWSDGVAAQSEAIINGVSLAANGDAHASNEFYAASGSITVATTLVSGTMTYNIYVVLEKLT